MLRRHLPTLIAAGLVALFAPLAVVCARRSLDYVLYFDHSMYQYTGWAVRHGERLYDAIAVPDGPLITWLHALVQVAMGDGDRGFRIADVVIQLSGALAIGFVLSRLAKSHRVLWTAAIASAWLAQYYAFDWHWIGQREAYYALGGYLGMALLATHRGRTWRALAGGALVGAQLFGKHSGVIFVILGLAGLIVTRDRRMLLRAVAGVAIGIGLCVVGLALTASFEGFWFWYFRVPPVYRFVTGSADFFPLLAAIDPRVTTLAVVALVLGIFALWRRLLPPTLLGFTLAPVAFLAAMVLQRKGHIYHAHPITAGAFLLAMLVLVHAARRAPVVAIVVAAFVGRQGLAGLLSSDWFSGHPVPTDDARLDGAHVDMKSLSETAAFVAAATRADERVFTYGPAARILHRAQRRSATGLFNNFFFNVRRAVVVPLDAGQQHALDQVQGAIAARECPRLTSSPPAALVVCDKAAWSDGPGLSDAAEVCPALTQLAESLYAERASFGCWRIFLRSVR